MLQCCKVTKRHVLHFTVIYWQSAPSKCFLNQTTMLRTFAKQHFRGVKRRCFSSKWRRFCARTMPFLPQNDTSSRRNGVISRQNGANSRRKGSNSRRKGDATHQKPKTRCRKIKLLPNYHNYRPCFLVFSKFICIFAQKHHRQTHKAHNILKDKKHRRYNQ